MECDPKNLPEVLAEYGTDSRNGVMRLLKQYAGIYEKLKSEELRLDHMLDYERAYGAYTYIAGIDEAGRGPLAGPVVAAGRDSFGHSSHLPAGRCTRSFKREVM